ncbi:hypothetical protein QR97_13220 [Streptomyces sp. PBH53]|uniref:hypothetical protein n=1 Tax=Streptomyces TaxID=1883 RepID=UPI000655484F|nr:hypothetical protein [Streptomyces sp. PBH53]AKN70653.1 hypothetical protein QR97_13220 [Streptomyces sp. PBH53]
MHEANDDLDGLTAAADLKIQLRPIGSVTASMRLPASKTREMLDVLMVGAAMAYGTAGPVLTMWVGTAQGVPIVATISIACFEAISAGAICWRALFRRRR